MNEYRFTLEEWDKALIRADQIIKKTDGHGFMTILKTRCENCGRSPRQKGICRNWQMAMIHRLLFVLMNKETELATSNP